MTIVKAKLTGTSPLVLHNNQCADPLNEFKKKIGVLTSKKSKTDADHLEIRRLEFLAGLYMGPNGPIVPSKNIRKMLIEAARKEKKGKQFEAGLYILGDADIEYDGPRDAKGMYEDGFAWTTPAGNQRSTIMRTRPRFDEWSLVFTAEIDDELISVSDFESSVKRAGKIALCDGRSIGMGRFVSEILEVNETAA